ncbi:PPM2 [Candida pseudojiufengensis]|uniref:PPM2 n=1 Tax=Candida pseudojiufengensis TaxID=497109 RepID=UPI002223F229|nr:PPM2 [Candida pseudojiufengensis]KAI5966311.1 PPM2 [Candida pseudojiufengensis]
MNQQNLKKSEKLKRKQKYNDQQVQGTNNSSIVSKRSVEKLYFSKLEPNLGEWFKEFVFNSKRRSPSINRGYWIRMESIRLNILKIIELHKNQKINIINLGCGFDPLPFQLLSSTTNDNLNFIDIDYPDLVYEKFNHIQNSTKIMELIGESIPNEYKLNCSNYKLIGCDLKETSSYQKLIDKLFPTSNNNEVNIFIAEVSLAYMDPNFANPIIEISSKVSNSNFLILEQIIPDGSKNSFAKKMLYHFNHLRSPIQCVEKYSTKRLQYDRFKNFYKNVNINDLFQNWENLVDDITKFKLNQIEEFDEWEEFILFCQHYFVIHANNDSNSTESSIPKEEIELDKDSSVTFSIFENSDTFELKFPAIAKFKDNIIINGGLKQSRTNETLQLNQQGKLTKIDLSNQPTPRMCHSLTSIGDKLILIGGRSKPNDIMNDIYEFDGDQWIKLIELDEGRYRHSVVVLNNEELLIFGGATTGDPFIKFNIITKKITSLKIEGEIESLFSSSMTYKNGIGYIYGGYSEVHLPKVNDKLYKFTIEKDTIHITPILQNNLLSRISSKSILLPNNKLIIIGGISSTKILTSKTNIISLDLTTLNFKSIEISQEIYELQSPIFIGFSCIENSDNESLILGGGCVCYSFGSCYNGIYKLNY